GRRLCEVRADRAWCAACLWVPSPPRPFSLSEEQPRAVRVPDPAIRESAAGVGYTLHQCADEGGWRARHGRGCAARLASVGCGERISLILAPACQCGFQYRHVLRVLCG